MRKYQKLHFLNFYLYFQIFSISLLSNVNCYPILGVMIAHYLSINFIYLLDLKNIVNNLRYTNGITDDFRYFEEEGYWFVFRFTQIISFILGLVAVIYLSAEDRICTESKDRNITLVFYLFSISLIILAQLYLKHYKPNRVSVVYSLNILKDILKGKINFQKLEECAICLEEKMEEPVESVILNCKHTFHYICLNNCFLNNINRCPMCREVYI